MSGAGTRYPIPVMLPIHFISFYSSFYRILVAVYISPFLVSLHFIATRITYSQSARFYRTRLKVSLTYTFIPLRYLFHLL